MVYMPAYASSRFPRSLQLKKSLEMLMATQEQQLYFNWSTLNV